jgi:phospholipid/cholesterol/gamma-HCH transport system substrate-binding protein
MQKQAPTLGRMLAMVVFALSCAGLLLWLWLSFGGPVPLQPEGFRFKAHFEESPLLVKEADVRMAGLTVGKTKGLELNKRGGAEVEMEIEDDFAPIPANSRVILRQKSLLGQIYVEITPGDRAGPKLQEGETLPDAQVGETTQLEEIIRTFDRPTRRNFQGWVREVSTAISRDRGEDLNNAIGNFDDFAASGADLLAELDEQEPALRGLVRNTGVALGALNQREGEFRRLVVNANDFFGALASQNDALAETIAIFPTFLLESRQTLDRLRNFAANTRPLVRDLIPVAILLRPTIHDLGRLAPDLKKLFQRLEPVIDESGDTLPDAARFLRGAEPVFESLHAYLPELNPFLSFANFEQEQLADFFMIGGGSFNAKLPGLPGEGPRHYLRSISIQNSRSLGIQQTRPEYERAIAYGAPNYLKRDRPLGVIESFDCKPSGGERPDPSNGPSPPAQPPCFVAPPSLWDGGMFPTLSRGEAPLRRPPEGNAGTQEPTIGR